MTDFVPQHYPLWIAWRIEGRIECGRVVAWTPSDSDTGLLLPLVAAEGARGRVAGAAVPPHNVGWHVGGSRDEASRAADPHAALEEIHKELTE